MLATDLATRGIRDERHRWRRDLQSRQPRQRKLLHSTSEPPRNSSSCAYGPVSSPPFLLILHPLRPPHSLSPRFTVSISPYPTHHPPPISSPLLLSYRYVAFLSGRTQITIPNSPQQAIFEGGKYGLILAADTAALTTVGHVSTTLEEEVTALQIPTLNGELPGHVVLYEGACRDTELGY